MTAQTTETSTPRDARHRVVVIGGGFGGLTVAKELAGTRAHVTLIDRRNHHLFQPLLYQVATGALSPANIATPLRGLFGGKSNVEVLLAEVETFDLDARRVILADGAVDYDTLVVASGSTQSYFGRDEWRDFAPGLKSLDDATSIRRRVLLAFEAAERETDPEACRALLTFIVVGGGPTGVELAGALAEVAHRTLRGEFRHVDPADARVLLIEASPRLLPPFAESSSRRAQRDLEKLGVTVRTRTMVVEMHVGGIAVRPTDDEDATPEAIPAGNILWAAGVRASALGSPLAEQSDAEPTRSGQLPVEADCTLPGRPEVFVIGDLASYRHGTDEALPGQAPVAMQQGRYTARRILDRLAGESPTEPFRYFDKGQMAVIGRSKAVAEAAGLRFGGLPAWLAWLFVHLMYLTEFENRVLVLIQWGWNYLTKARSARLITGSLDENSRRWVPVIDAAEEAAEETEEEEVRSLGEQVESAEEDAASTEDAPS